MEWYGKLRSLGLNYGSAFQTLQHVYRTGFNSISAEIDLDSTRGMMVRESPYAVHPATLDGCLQAAFIATQDQTTASPSRAFLPARIQSMTVSASNISGEHCGMVRGHGQVRGLRQANTTFELVSPRGETMVNANVIFASVEGGFGSADKVLPQPYQRIRWDSHPHMLDGPDEEEGDNPVLPNGTNGVNVEERPKSAAGSNHPLWLIYNENFPQESLRDLPSSLHPLAESTTISDVSAVPRGACVVMLAQLDLTNMDERMFKNLQTICQRASHLVWTTCGDDPASFIMHGMMKVLETEYPNLSVSCLDFQDSHHDTNFIAATAISQILHRATNPLVEKHISIKAGIPYICRYVLDDDANANEQSSHQVLTTEGIFEPGLTLDMQHVGKAESAFFKRAPLGISRSDSTANVLIRPVLYSMTQREARSLLGRDFSTALSRELLGVVVRATNSSALKVGQQVVALASGRFESEVEVLDALCLPANPDLSVIGQLAPFCIAMQALDVIGRVRRGDGVLIHCGSNLLTVVASQIASQMGAKVR